MIVIPALDIRAGECDQSTASADLEKRAQLSDPMTAARYWAACGFTRLHVRDLDADAGRGDNNILINSILRENTAAVQVAGGTPSNERIDELLSNGARFVIATFESPSRFGSLESAVELWPDAIVAGITTRDSRDVNQPRRNETESENGKKPTLFASFRACYVWPEAFPWLQPPTSDRP